MTSVLTDCTPQGGCVLLSHSPARAGLVCPCSVKMRLLRPWELVLLQTALFEADHWSRTATRESVAAFATLVWSEKENIQ